MICGSLWVALFVVWFFFVVALLVFVWNGHGLDRGQE